MTMEQQDPTAPASDSPPLEALIVEALQSIYDPEIPVSIYALGLIYDIAIDSDSKVLITMTLTTPGCPVAEILPMEIEEKVRAVPGVESAQVEITWEPPWRPDMMSEAARLELGMF
jgi:FeS assembly SUF system protein